MEAGRTKKIKRYEELKFTDDFMFAKVLQNDPDLCKGLIELILGKQIPGLVGMDAQYTIATRYDARGVRLDVIVEDRVGTVYDIEMQIARFKHLPRRCRYYHGMLALDQIGRGGGYAGLKETYVIFICVDGLMEGFDDALYTFQNRCDADPAITLGDGAHTVLLNASCKNRPESEELSHFLDYLKTGAVSEDAFVQRIEDRVEDARMHKEWRAEYMLLLERDRMNREEGRIKGQKEERERMARLFSWLLHCGRIEDAERASSDPEYCELLLRQAGLSET